MDTVETQNAIGKALQEEAMNDISNRKSAQPQDLNMDNLVERIVNLDDVIVMLVNAGYLNGGEIVDKIKPFHGNCCCCQDCGQQHDYCVCEHNELLIMLLSLPLISQKEEQ
jgi:hypothetical protein